MKPNNNTSSKIKPGELVYLINPTTKAEYEPEVFTQVSKITDDNKPKKYDFFELAHFIQFNCNKIGVECSYYRNGPVVFLKLWKHVLFTNAAIIQTLHPEHGTLVFYISPFPILRRVNAGKK